MICCSIVQHNDYILNRKEKRRVPGNHNYHANAAMESGPIVGRLDVD